MAKKFLFAPITQATLQVERPPINGKDMKRFNEEAKMYGMTSRQYAEQIVQNAMQEQQAAEQQQMQQENVQQQMMQQPQGMMPSQMMAYGGNILAYGLDGDDPPPYHVSNDDPDAGFSTGNTFSMPAGSKINPMTLNRIRPDYSKFRVTPKVTVSDQVRKDIVENKRGINRYVPKKSDPYGFQDYNYLQMAPIVSNAAQLIQTAFNKPEYQTGYSKPFTLYNSSRI